MVFKTSFKMQPLDNFHRIFLTDYFAQINSVGDVAVVRNS